MFFDYVRHPEMYDFGLKLNPKYITYDDKNDIQLCSTAFL